MTKLALITGASSGIGQALAQRYYAAGYKLALVARRTQEMEAWVQTQGLARGRYAIYGADVSLPQDIMAAGRRCVADQGVPDVVVANAGISVGVDSRRERDIEVIARTFATNNTGMAATFQPFIDAMRERGSGALVGIASVAGIRGLPGHAAYCASKAGVIVYCESLRGELRGSGVVVVTIVPGYIDTPLTRRNRYPMPFLMPADAFADKAFRAIEARASYRVIPWQMGVAARMLRLLPNAALDRALAGRPRKHREDE